MRLYFSILVRVTKPAIDNGLLSSRVAVLNYFRSLLYFRHQLCVTSEVGNFVLGQTRLPGAKQFTRPAKLKVPLRDKKTVVGFAEHAEAAFRQLPEWLLVKHDAVTLIRAATDAPT